MMKITAVVVFYKQEIERSKTFASLKDTLKSRTESPAELEVILYDNGPDKQDFEAGRYWGANFTYIHDPRNLGIATAYNFAWAQAGENGSEWLLLLDHDTELTDEYFDHILRLGSPIDSVAAIVPQIKSNGVGISPVFSSQLRPLQGERPGTGLQETPVMAINSGALIKLSFLNEIGGFNNGFALDYLDHWLFNEVYKRGQKVWVMDVILEHDLSVMDYSQVSINRYQSILDSEIRFYKEHKPELYRPYKMQLAKRFLKQLLLVRNKQIAGYTFKRLISMEKGHSK
ncbi:glycosyltransferase [Mesobacillus boroniphilus]|uniref:Glycosyltransferase n=1 Tax=Mesobacillus boroniphilus TaxID=308892 RepID=A0A944CNP1_9BACI|nr:glycosyltransferase [Mesobacillus boroniphilus]MBS8265756.1 glycosyltransferase [Mesobacillus boroniphilus]